MVSIGTRRWFAGLFIATLMVAFSCPGVAHAANGHITGTVTESGTGDPIEGIRVVPLHLEGDWWAEDWAAAVDTGANGAFDLGPLVDGTYRIRFVDVTGLAGATPGDAYYGYQYWPSANWADNSQDIEVGDGLPDTGKDQVLSLGAKISGTVTADRAQHPSRASTQLLRCSSVVAGRAWLARGPM